MAFEKKTWVDRRVPYPGRRTLVDVETNISKTYDVSRAEGVPYEVGTDLNADTFNDLESRIYGGFGDTSDAIDSVSSTVGNLSSTVDGLSTTVGTLSGTVDTLTTSVAGKQDVLTPGTGISIVNNVISVSLTDADVQEY